MSVWDRIVGQAQVVSRLRFIASQEPGQIAQSWLICGPVGSGRNQVARAFAAALMSPDHAEGEPMSKQAAQVLSGAHPDVCVLTTDKVTISVDEARSVLSVCEQMPSIAPWRVIIIEDFDRMLERSTNVLLKEIEEPSEHTIWILCASSVQSVLPTIRSRTQHVTLCMPDEKAVAAYLERHAGQEVSRELCATAARYAQGNLDVAMLYVQDEQALQERNDTLEGVLDLHHASDAVMLAAQLIGQAQQQAQEEVDRDIDAEQREFRRINGLADDDKIPPRLSRMYQAIGKKDDVKRRITRRSRDVLYRVLDALTTLYRDVCVVHASAQDTVGLINQEYVSRIKALADSLSSRATLDRIAAIETARRRLGNNGNVTLVFEALFCALLID